eukprot:g5042.t1
MNIDYDFLNLYHFLEDHILPLFAAIARDLPMCVTADDDIDTSCTTIILIDQYDLLSSALESSWVKFRNSQDILRLFSRNPLIVVPVLSSVKHRLRLSAEKRVVIIGKLSGMEKRFNSFSYSKQASTYVPQFRVWCRKHLSAFLPPKAHTKSCGKQGKNVVFVQRRKGSGRTFLNYSDAVKKISKNTLNLFSTKTSKNSCSENVSLGIITGDFKAGFFHRQVRLLLNADILIAAHGAALAGLFLLPTHAVVIEILPKTTSLPQYRFFHPIPAYRQLTKLMRIQYKSLYADEI